MSRLLILVSITNSLRWLTGSILLGMGVRLAMTSQR